LKTKAAVLCACIAAVLFFTMLFVESAEPQPSAQVVSILPDGSVQPSSVAIQRNGDTYVFTGNVYARGISIEKPDITIDGAGYTLMGPYNGTQSLWIIGNGPNQTLTNDSELWSIGIDTVTNTIGNLTIENLNIKNFSIGVYLWTEGNKVTGNAITNSIVGILISGADNTITSNYIANNKNGVFFGSNGPSYLPANIQIYENRFVDNDRQLSGCVCVDYNFSEAKHYWDNGTVGNFWSDYNGTEVDHTGIGSTPYIIDPLNMDRYPLTTSSVTPPKVVPDIHVIIGIGALAVTAAALAVLIVFRRRKKKETPSVL